MHREQLDELARGLATARVSRWQALKALGAGAVVGVLSFFRSDRVEAATCKPVGKTCTGHTQCCSKFCSGGVCRCKAVGKTCAGNQQCCSGICFDGVCRCKAVNKSCTANRQCCSGICIGGLCRCKANGKSCTSGKQCCSGRCESGSCSPPVVCGTDLPTAASIESARAALAAGATDVALSPGGCWRYSRTLSGTAVTSERASAAGKTILIWNHTDTESTGQEDANRDGFFETRTRIVRGQTTDDERMEVTELAPTTQALIRRETYTRTGDTIHALWERDDGTGSLEVEAEFDTTPTQSFAGTGQSSDITPRAGCTVNDEKAIRDRLEEAVIKGFRCMRDKGRPDIGTKLLTYYSTRKVVINCGPLGGQIASMNPWSVMFNNSDITIFVNPTAFFARTHEQQLNTLWHEMLHLQGKSWAHDSGQEDQWQEGKFPRYKEVDRVWACAGLCFSDDPADRTKCACARCLGTNKCDSRCGSYLECDGDMGAYCPCLCNSRWYDKATTCAVECPSGLCCFASRCRGHINVNCPP